MAGVGRRVYGGVVAVLLVSMVAVSPVAGVGLVSVLFDVDFPQQASYFQISMLGGAMRSDGALFPNVVPQTTSVSILSVKVDGEQQAANSCWLTGDPSRTDVNAVRVAGKIRFDYRVHAFTSVPTGDRCAGYAAAVAEIMDTELRLVITVPDVYPPPATTTATTTVTSVFPSIAQHNQTILRAKTTWSSWSLPVDRGFVTFSDGARTLGQATVGPDGMAYAVVSIPDAGTRTITATYTDTTSVYTSCLTCHRTTVTVTGAPEGSPLGGALSISGRPVTASEGSVVTPPAPGSWGGGSTWFLPLEVSGTVPGAGSGPTSAEVRLLDLGSFTVDPAGVHGRYWLQVRSVTVDGVTTVPLGCINEVEVTFADDGAGRLTAVSGSSVRIPEPWCGGAAAAWANALTGPVTGELLAALN